MGFKGCVSIGYDYPDARSVARSRKIRRKLGMPRLASPLTDAEYRELPSELKDCFIKVDYYESIL